MALGPVLAALALLPVASSFGTTAKATAPSLAIRSPIVARRAAVVAAVSELGSEKELNAALSDAGDKLVVVDYSTSWCGPCKVIAPKFEEFSEQYADADFFKVIGDSSSAANKLMSKQGIRAVPTFQLWKNKAKVCEISGAKAGALEEAIQANV